jgi:hypothetical protein
MLLKLYKKHSCDLLINAIYIWTSLIINTMKQAGNFSAHHTAWCVIAYFFFISKCWVSCGNRHRTRNIIYTWRACHGPSNWKAAHVTHYSYMPTYFCFWTSSCVMRAPSINRQLGDNVHTFVCVLRSLPPAELDSLGLLDKPFTMYV